MKKLQLLPYCIDKSLYEPKYKEGSVIHIAGLGDVGGTLTAGLRLIGGKTVSRVGIFDLDQKKIDRWLLEAGQIYASFRMPFPYIFQVKEDELFNCDIFAFCVTAGIPPIGYSGDVRMYQYKNNVKIVEGYIEKAVKAGFKGLFAVISDPVDQLCLAALRKAQKLDPSFSPMQIRGYGLGVMYARALFYASQNPETKDFQSKGRAFGPHGEGLVIANALPGYDDSLSDWLTEKAKNANLEVRETGFKPYIAPAFSSATMGLLATILGEWHYSSIYLDGAFLGIRNKTSEKGSEIEFLPMPIEMIRKIKCTHKKLQRLPIL